MKKIAYRLAVTVLALLVSASFLMGRRDNHVYRKVKWGMTPDTVKEKIRLDFNREKENSMSAATSYLGLPTTVIYAFKSGRLSGIILKIDLGDEKSAEILADHYNKISADLSKTYGEYKNYDAFEKGEKLTVENDTGRALFVLMSKLKWKRDWIAGDTTVIAEMAAARPYTPDITVYIFKKESYPEKEESKEQAADVVGDGYLYTRLSWGMDPATVKETIGLKFTRLDEDSIAADTLYLGLRTSIAYVFYNNRLVGIVLQFDLKDEKRADILAGHFNRISDYLSKTFGEYRNHDILEDDTIKVPEDFDRALAVLMNRMRWERDWDDGETSVIARAKVREPYVPDLTVYIFKKK